MSNYKVEAQKKEELFWKRWKKRATFFTCRGKQNFLHDLTSEEVVFKSSASEIASIKISRKNLRKAISFFMYNRNVTRDELEQFSEFSSALWAVLKTIFCEIVKVKKCGGVYRLVLKGVRFFPAGMERSVRDLTIAVECGAKFVLVSVAHLRNENIANFLSHIRRMGLHLLVDSGAYTIYQAQKKGQNVKPITIEEYIEILTEIKKAGVLYRFFNLDVIGDSVATRENFDKLKSLGWNAIPVWHCQSSVEELQLIVEEGHEIIAIGGSAVLNSNSQSKRRMIFREVFSRFKEQLFHLLGTTSKIIFEFEFFSCDSTTAQVASKFGRIIDDNLCQRKAPADWTKEKRLTVNFKKLLSVEKIAQKPPVYEQLLLF